MSDLSAFLRRAAAQPFGYGRLDCCLFIADWVRETRGFDPAAAYRDRYATERHALRLVAAAGGLQALLAPCLAPLPRTSDPVAGDVGVVLAGSSELAAIRVGTGWACKGRRGLVVTSADLLTAWSLDA